MTLWVGLALFVIVDLIVVIFVIRRVMAQRAGLGGVGLAGLARFASEATEETRSYLSAHYGGDPASLPGVLQGLVDRLAQRATEQGMTLDRDTLKRFAATAVISVGAAKAGDVRAAIESVG